MFNSDNPSEYLHKSRLRHSTSLDTRGITMSKQLERDIAIVPVNTEPSDIQNDTVFASDVEKKPPIASNMQAGVQKADLLRATWTKQGLIMVFAGYVELFSLISI